jgi:hypothetical protein
MPYLIAAVAFALIGAAGYLARPLRLDPRRRAELAEAVSAVDRELAGNLELMSMFDQTKQPVVLEVGEYARHRATIGQLAARSATTVADLYNRIPEAEAAMERRGPANSIKDADRRLIEAWEGDARAAQRSLRATLKEPPVSGWRAAVARLQGGSVPQ